MGRAADALWRALALTGAALALAVPAAVADNTARPDAINQPLQDGCQRNPAGLLTFSSPEWVWVYGGDPVVRVVEGTAHVTAPAGEDLPENHTAYDIDSNVAPDPPYEYLLGGDPQAHNGNFGLGADGKPAEDTNRLHVEWESTTLPPFAWPTENDRVKIWGPWIWDCGHWGQGVSDPDYFLPGDNPPVTPEGLRGEQTEIHPMQAIVVTRSNPYRPAVKETEADAFISSNGTKAFGEEKCTHDHPAPPSTPGAPPPAYGADWTACVATTTHQVVNDRDYSFFVPAPTKPSANAVLRYREVDMGESQGSPQESVDVRGNGITVTVHFADSSPTDDMRYARSFFVGWEGASIPVDHLQVDFKTVKVVNSLDPNPGGSPQSSPPPGEYNLYTDVNGYWRLLNDWAPGLGAVLDGQSFDLNRTVDIFVPRNSPLRVLVNGRECDLPQMTPCADTTEVSSGNDHPGDALVAFASSSSAIGEHTIRPSSGDYEVTFDVRNAPGAVSNAAGPGPCVDTRAPRSRVARRYLRVRRHRVRARGAASDRGCGPARRRIRRTQVALALRVGHRCRFLGPRGRLRRRASCRRALFLTARGTRRWRFSKRARLRRGRYLLLVRSIDRAGNVEYRRTRLNAVRFRVR